MRMTAMDRKPNPTVLNEASLHLHHVSRYVALSMREVLHGEVLLEDLVDYGFQDCRVVRLGEGLQIGELH